MKDNRYEEGDNIPKGKLAGDIISITAWREAEGIEEPAVREPKVKLRSRVQLEEELNDALKRIEVLENKDN